jgi:hypothetical protein
MAEPKVSSHQQALNIAEALETKLKSNVDLIKQQGRLQSWLNGELQETEQIYSVINKDGVVRNKISKKDLENVQNQLGLSNDLGDSISELAPGMTSFAVGAEKSVMAFKGMLGPIGTVIGIVVLLAKLWIDIAKNIAETRKDLGVSAAEAVKLNVAFKGLEFAGKAFGLEAEDIKESFKAARDNLGATTDEALGLSLNLAKVAMQSGTSADQLTQVLSIMESVSSASRDALLAQIEINRQLIGSAGLAPADIFRDIADNAEFFAQFAKDGSQNLIQAGIAARKLGLNMSAVAGITESLLDFESSIEKQLEASLLLGRQINLDRARQLALAGDQAGMMEEILRAVGGEAEFNRMNVIQRKALAESVGVNVEQLSRLVRNNTAGAAGAAVAGIGKPDNVFSDPEAHRYLKRIATSVEG